VSKVYPECPLSKHDNCREYYSPKVCAVVRKDKICLRKRKGLRKDDKKRTHV